MKLKLHLQGKRGVDILHDPDLNKGTGFTDAERDLLGLRGLLPPRVSSLDLQVKRVLENLRRKSSPIEKYIFLSALQDRNETLFYRLVTENLEEMMPLVYTPTVGQGCQEYGHIFRRPRGIYITLKDRGRMKQLLGHWPHHDVRMIVVTDGERILGLGDLGANGMGIPVGKLALYTACAGVPPQQCLPVMLDVGTNNEALLADPLYIGVPERRVQGAGFDEIVDEFYRAVHQIFPKACIQLEDFANTNAFRMLAHYRDRSCTFDDDIQGTAGVILAGILAALKPMGIPLAKQRLLFLGAGEAGIGIGDLVVAALKAGGIPEAEARRQCWFFDSKALVVKARANLAEHKLPYAHDHPPVADFLQAVETLKPTGIIGVSGNPQTFTEPVVRAMARINKRPIVFALSNPTSKSECTAEQAYRWTDGAAFFASGSPFDAVKLNGRTYVPGQGNNAYVFPGVGLGVIAAEATRVTDEMFLVAAQELAKLVTGEDLALGRIYPSLTRIREVSAAIAVSVAETAFRRGLTIMRRPADLAAHVKAQMYEPVYPDYS